jgi:hypothetical protein
MHKVTFEARIDYAHCINTLVEVTGSDEEGIILVSAIGIGHVGEDITDDLSVKSMDRLYEELQEHLTDAEADKIDRTYDEMREQPSLRLMRD